MSLWIKKNLANIILHDGERRCSIKKTQKTSDIPT